jgi:Uma2 family endonuclease
MPATTLQPSVESGVPPRVRFTRDQVEQMMAAGLFAGQKFELIQGDLIDKMGPNPPHAFAIRILAALLGEIFGALRISAQTSIEIAYEDRRWSWPEPDIAVLAEAKEEYTRRLPRGNELVLLVEVADTSVRYDSITKRDLYARAGVPEYWVLDIQGQQLVIHRDLEHGLYKSVRIVAAGEEAAPQAAPDRPISLAKVLGN